MSPSIQPLLLALRLIPDALPTQVLARLLTHLLRGQSIAGRLDDLQGRRIAIHISDSDSRLVFQIRGTQLRAATPTARGDTADVTLRGSLTDFWLLATRAEDPDTLFFNRRLSIEGDTETALTIKNLLDALEFDWPAHVTAVLGQPAAGWLIPLIHKIRRAARHLPRAGA